MKMPYDQRPSVTIGALPNSRWFSSGRSSTSGATRPAATSAPIAVFTVNCAALLGTNPAGPASSMPASNQEKNAGGQVNGLRPAGAANGIQPQNQLATATTAIAGTRARTGSRAASTARIGSAT